MIKRLFSFYNRHSDSVTDICMATGLAAFAVAGLMGVASLLGFADRGAYGMACIGGFYLVLAAANTTRVPKTARTEPAPRSVASQTSAESEVFKPNVRAESNDLVAAD